MVKTFNPAEIAWAMTVAGADHRYSDTALLCASEILLEWTTEIQRRNRHLEAEVKWRTKVNSMHHEMQELVRAGK